MAYQAFGFATGETVLPAPDRDVARFTGTEWAVVRLARGDTLASIGPGTRLGTLILRLFGLERVNRLADPRLEALRQVAVLCWRRGGAIDQFATATLTAHGFDRDQIASLCAHVGTEIALSGVSTRRR